MATLDITVPPKLVGIFATTRKDLSYRVLRGGRGSGKSFTAAKMAAIWGATEKLRILCTREYQNSIKESFHAELKNAIESEPWLAQQYDVGRDYLRHKTNGTEFLFAGLRHNISSIKSMAQIDLCIVEEAETVPHQSWIDLLPTIRAEGSGFIIIYNPKRRDSWVAQTFDNGALPPRTAVVDVNHYDNPWFPTRLQEQLEHDRQILDGALFRHIWEGAYYENSDAQVFSGRYRIAEFDPTPEWGTPLQGLDFGFSQDPTAAVRVWVYDGTLYIEHELYQTRLEIDETASAIIEAIPDADRFRTIADNARPETISYLRRSGLPKVKPCEKGKGSVDDGIMYMRSFKEIVIHPRCRNTAKEFDLYSWRVDKVSGKILDTPQDAFNHAIDAIRYALEPLIKRKQSFLTRARQ